MFRKKLTKTMYTIVILLIMTFTTFTSAGYYTVTVKWYYYNFDDVIKCDTVGIDENTCEQFFKAHIETSCGSGVYTTSTSKVISVSIGKKNSVSASITITTSSLCTSSLQVKFYEQDGNLNHAKTDWISIPLSTSNQYSSVYMQSDFIAGNDGYSPSNEYYWRIDSVYSYINVI